MASINHGVNPGPIGPPNANSRSSSNASSAASAASAAALASPYYNVEMNGAVNGAINGTVNSTANGTTSGASNGYSSNSSPNGAAASVHSPMSMPFGPGIDTNGANKSNGLNGIASALQMHLILVRRITIGNSSKAISHLADFCSQGLLHAEAIDAEQSKDPGYMSAIFRYDTMQNAALAVDKLNGMRNITFDNKMSAEFLGPDQSPFGPTTTAGAYTPMLARAPQSATLLPQPAGPFTNNAFQMGGGLGSSAIVHEVFSRPSPIGNHLSDRGVRTSSLDLINSGSGSDDPLDFGRLSLNDNSSLDAAPTGISTMAESSRPQLATQRRSTMPHLKTLQNLSSLRLDTAMLDSVNGGVNGMQPSGYANPAYARGQAPYSAHPSHPAHSAHPMNSMSAGGLNGNTSFHPHRRGPHHHQPHGRHMVPHVNPSDQHPPCNTLYVGNIPMDAKESELKALFSTQRGYKRLSLRTRNNNTMCFVEFEDITAATKALDELFGRPLSNSNHRGGMRLSYSKNPFGVRSEHNPNNRSNAPSSMLGMNQPLYSNGQAAGAGTVTVAPAPPPGLPVPPSMNPALQHRADGLLATAGSQILPSSAYAQVSPWHQPQQIQPMAQQMQQVPQPYGMSFPPAYQSYEDDEDVFTNGGGGGGGGGSGSASLLGSSGAGNPLGNYAFQSNGASSAFNASSSGGYNPAFGSGGANGLINGNGAGMDGLGGSNAFSVRTGSNGGAGASMAYNADPNGRAYYNGNGPSHMAYRPFS